jgi:hypothetical protein
MELERTRDNQNDSDEVHDSNPRADEPVSQKPSGKTAYLLNLQRENRIIERNRRIKEVMG